MEEEKDMSYAAIRARAAKNPGSAYLAPLTAHPKHTKGDSYRYRRRVETMKRKGEAYKDNVILTKRGKIKKIYES